MPTAKKQQATKETTVVPNRADTGEVIQPPPPADALANAVLDRVLQRIDIDGLLQKVLDEAATRLAKSIHIESLIESVVGQQEQQLTELRA